MSNGLDPDQNQHSVSPDLGPKCLQRLSADAKSRRKQGKYWNTYAVSVQIHDSLRIMVYVLSDNLAYVNLSKTVLPPMQCKCIECLLCHFLTALRFNFCVIYTQNMTLQ